MKETEITKDIFAESFVPFALFVVNYQVWKANLRLVC
jgi:hypothetical protein